MPLSYLNDKGFSLLEMMLASVILAFVIASVSSIGLIGKAMTRKAETQSKAAHANQMTAESLRNAVASDQARLEEVAGGQVKSFFDQDLSTGQSALLGDTTRTLMSSDLANPNFSKTLPEATSGYYHVTDVNVAGHIIKVMKVTTEYENP